MATSPHLQPTAQIPPSPAIKPMTEEQDSLRQRIQILEAQLARSQHLIDSLQARNERLLQRLSRGLFSEKDYEAFDPAEFTVPVEEMLADARKSMKTC